MSSPPFSQPLPFISWGLVLDGDVQIEAGSSHDGDVSSAVTHIAATHRTVKPPVHTPGASSALQRKARSARSVPSDTAPRLDDWEVAAVEVYRELRRHRGDVPPRQGSGGVSGTTGVSSDGNALPRLAAFMATAFPQLLEHPTPNAPTAHEELRSVPLLLQYFLQVGYPARAHGASSTSAATHIATAAQTVTWFTEYATECDPSAAEVCARPVGRCFPAGLLPDVVQQTIGANHMRPATAASWLLRVFVGLLGPEEVREHRAHNALLRRHGQPATPPGSTTPVTLCLQALRHWAVVVSGAVYQVQATARGACLKRAAAAAAGAASHYVGDHCDIRTDGDSDWCLFSLRVLRPTVMLLLRGCLHDASADALRVSSVKTVEAEAETLLPPAPATRVVVDGLARLALTLCQHTQFPSRATADARAADVDEQQDVARKHWDAYTQLAVQQLPHLPPHYSYLVPILDHVLSV